jgi:hypothetical protein
MRSLCARWHRGKAATSPSYLAPRKKDGSAFIVPDRDEEKLHVCVSSRMEERRMWRLSLVWADKQLQTLRLQPHGGTVKAIDDVSVREDGQRHVSRRASE